MASKKEMQALIVLAGKMDPSLQKALKQTQKGVGGIASASKLASKVVGGAFKLAAKATAVGTTAIGAGLAYVGTKGLEMASDLTEVQNVVDTTFGTNSKKIDAWSQTALKSFGLSELSAKKYSSTMGAMLKSTGISGTAMLTMSENLTGLSGDMASFYNLSQDDAFEKIQAGIAGETKPLKDLGINMSVANLQAYALSKGIKTSYDKMDQASQTTLRYNYLLNATKDAQGDFNKTSGTFANQTKLMKSNIQQLAAKIMTAALPGFEKLLQLGNNLLDSALGNPEFIQKFQDFISNAMNKVVELAPQAIDWLAGLGPKIQDFYDKAVIAYDFITNNWPYIAPVIGGVTGALIALEVASKAAMVIQTLSFMWTAATIVMDGLTMGISAAAIAQDLLNLAWRTSSVGVVMTAIGLIIAGGIAVYENWSKISKLFSDIGSWFAKVGSSIGKFFGLGDKTVNLQTNYGTTNESSIKASTYPMYASGGFADRPSIFGDAGPEAAIPLKHKSPRSLSILNQTAKAIGADDDKGHAQIQLIYSPTITGGSNMEIDSKLKAQAEEFKAWLEEYFADKRRVSFE